MQAMVLAAGEGTRLRPLTRHLPKPLFPVLNVPCVERILRLLVAAGFERVIVNTFHLAGALASWASSLEIEPGPLLLKEPDLLGTGGALANARPYIDPGSPLLLMNADVVTDLDPGLLLGLHRRGEALATLFVHDRPRWNNLLVQGGLLKGLEYAGKDAVAFTGISVIEPGFLDCLPEERPCSLVDGLKEALAAGQRIQAVDLGQNAGDYVWEDIGTPRGYLAAHEALLERSGKRLFGIPADRLSGNRVTGWVCAGEDVEVGPGATLGRTVIWEGSAVPPGEDIRSSIVTPFGILRQAGPHET